MKLKIHGIIIKIACSPLTRNKKINLIKDVKDKVLTSLSFEKTNITILKIAHIKYSKLGISKA